ncbi:MAG: D-alanine--D-alanine ligase (EC [uncultured Thiotrichaceae bacterium]|uniref:D-alanine--D-alanine ligase n=1 Tax=uncultured Thiotrichaceae bacterium TaxID=298394 RepID=A0A6S6SIL7_9GAMM|nr:MAG: D-alanine--D-alanine ligase (EC [uncultured Thiotrichaceae bacterium]
MSDMSRFGRVAVLLGGLNAEREVSLNSGAAVLRGLQEAGVDAHGIDVGEDIIAVLQSGNYDRVFNILHGRVGEDGVIQGALELLGIPYTGCGVMASALCMDKLMTKRVWLGAGLPTPEHRILTEETDFDAIVAELGLPLAVKPVREGSSVGISKVTRAEQLKPAFELAVKSDPVVMAEQWIVGDEYTVSMLDGEALPVIRIEPEGDIYDYEAKYLSDNTQYHCPCGLSAGDELTMQQLAQKAFAALDGESWGRVDLMRGEDGRNWLIEVNTNPGMTDHSLVPKAAKQVGYNFSQLVVRILETTL